MRATDSGYYAVLTRAVQDFAVHGYDSQERLEHWLGEIRRAAERDLVSERQLVADVARSFNAQFARLVDQGAVLKQHPGVSRFTLDRVRPALREELSRRILASASLIKLDRERAIGETLRRFSGWATSVPPGGDADVARNPVKSDIRRSLARTPYELRRVTIDQGHKLAANINAIVAQGSGAIAAVWRHHHVRYPRAAHVERDGKVYLIRGSWAHEKGLVKPGPAGYLDEITQPGEEIMCRCTCEFRSSLGQLPVEMLTEKGRTALAEARKRMGIGS